MNNIKELGFTQSYQEEAKEYPGLFPGRIISQYKGLYSVVTEAGRLLAAPSGKMQSNANSPLELPAVGDFVMLDRKSSDHGNGVIQSILTRKSSFVRKAAGTAKAVQIVAANIDQVFLCMSLNLDYNLRRLERYISIAWDSAASPVIVLTKADLCEDVDIRLAEVEAIAIGIDIIVTSAEDISGIRDHIRPGQTIALIGSSGVGKSTLINHLIGKDELDTQGLRDDDKGRHTTTRRELILLPGGAMIIDTPGMRELGLESADLSKSFADIETLAKDCKFHDCSHTVEPGCAVLEAVAAGELARERLDSYQKLQTELGYEGLSAKQIEAKKLNRMFGQVGGMKNARKFAKEKNQKR